MFNARPTRPRYLGLNLTYAWFSGIFSLPQDTLLGFEMELTAPVRRRYRGRGWYEVIQDQAARIEPDLAGVIVPKHGLFQQYKVSRRP